MPGVQRGEKEIPRRENNLCIVLEHGKNVDCSDYRKNTGRAGKVNRERRRWGQVMEYFKLGSKHNGESVTGALLH